MVDVARRCVEAAVLSTVGARAAGLAKHACGEMKPQKPKNKRAEGNETNLARCVLDSSQTAWKEPYCSR